MLGTGVLFWPCCLSPGGSNTAASALPLHDAVNVRGSRLVFEGTFKNLIMLQEDFVCH